MASYLDFYNHFMCLHITSTMSKKYLGHCGTRSVAGRVCISLVPRPFYVRSVRFHLEKGPGIQRLRACRIIPFSRNFVFFRVFSGVYYVMNIGWSQSVVSIVTMTSSVTIVSLSEDAFVNLSPFPCLDWGSLVCL